MNSQPHKPSGHSGTSQLDLAQLVNRANIALEGNDFDEAVFYLRTAVQRAPLRSDLRDSLFAAIGKQKLGKSSAAGPRPLRKPTQPPLFDNPMEEPGARVRIEEVPGGRRKPAHAADAPPPRRTVSETQELFGQDDFLRKPESGKPTAPRPAAAEPKSARRTGEARPNPASAMRLSLSQPRRGEIPFLKVGLALAAAALAFGVIGTGAMFLFGGREHGNADSKAALSDAERQDNELIARAEEYLNGRLYSLAIEQIQMMSDGARKSAMLARTYASQAEEFFSGKRYEEARRVYDKAAEAEPANDLWAYHSGWCSYMMGLEKRVTNRQAAQELFDRAEVSFKAAVQANPNQARALYGLGKIEVARNNRPAANEYYQKVLQIAPDSPEASLARGDLQAWGLDKPRSAPAEMTTAANTIHAAPPAAPDPPREQATPAPTPKVKTATTSLKTKI